MRAFAFFLAVVFALMFTASGENPVYLYAEDSEGNVLSVHRVQRYTEPPTQAEKDLRFEQQLINRLQDAIKDYFETVDEAVITVEKPSETERNIEVAIITKHGEQLTEEQEAGIINLINASFSSEFKRNVSLTQKERER